MSAEAGVNGWRGFEHLGRKVPGGTEYVCDGLPHPMGCPESVVVRRPWSKVGTKSTGWLVIYGVDIDEQGNETLDEDVVLAFGPKCAEVVRSQEKP